MTATDELRRLLDERGAEYTVDYLCHDVFWDFGEVGMARASAIGTKGLVQMIVTGITPQQAIEATLGRGECEIEERRDGWGVITRHCGNCGADLDCDTRNRQNYCPSCGLRLVRR